MRNFLCYDKPNLIMYDSLSMVITNASLPLQHAINSLGDKRAYLRAYHYRYFINNYISPAIDSIVNSYDGTYIDLGREMTSLSETFEFYMDYTHTTPAANLFIANRIANAIIPRFSNVRNK